MNLSEADFQSIRRWMYRSARPLDLARWQFHFENGSKEAVLAALSAYQNKDGGFGHALEADLWNPNSSPYVTSVAVNILEEVCFRDRTHPLIQKILAYLPSTPDFDGQHWAAIISSHEDYPHAPWWTDQTYDWGYTPTILLAGFILFYAGHDQPIYELAKKIIAAAVDRYLLGTMPDGKPYNSIRREGEIQCFHKMLAFVEESGSGLALDAARVRDALKMRAETFIEKDDLKWNQYCWKPSNFINSPGSLFYPGNEKAMDTELNHLLANRNPEGIWNITWSWGAYDKAFAISENWWKANLIITNLLMLRSFGRFPRR